MYSGFSFFFNSKYILLQVMQIEIIRIVVIQLLFVELQESTKLQTNKQILCWR